MGKQIPIVDYLVLDDGNPHLVGTECSTCGALYFDRRNACAKCGTRDFHERALANTGTVRACTIVYRAAKGIPTPYASAVIDLDGGGVVKANIVDTELDPEHIKLAMPVELTTSVAGTDDDGTEAIAFGYAPREKS